MLSKPLYKQIFKSNLTFLVLFVLIFLGGMAAVFELELKGHTSAEFLSYLLLEGMFLVIPCVYSIVMSARLVTRPVKSGTMSFFLSTGTGRSRILRTQAFFLITGGMILFIIITVGGILTGIDRFVQNCGPARFALLNLGAFALLICVSGICFFISCIAKEFTTALWVSGMVIFLFYGIHVVVDMEEGLSLLKYATFFTLFQPDGILELDFYALAMLVLLAFVGILFYAVGGWIFKKRELPL